MYNIFKLYPNEIFIETGTLDGIGVDMAIEAGFEKIYSIEASYPIYERNRIKFMEQRHVSIILGRSEIELPKLVSTLVKPATLWLDAHGSWEVPMLPDSSMCPLREELAGLMDAPCKQHTILVDDVDAFKALGVSVEMLTEMILKINPEYKIEIVDNHRRLKSGVIALISRALSASLK